MQNNLLIIFLSIIFSVILWVSISLSNDYSATLDLPIKFFNVPEGYTTASSSPSKVKIKVKGKGWNILSTLLTARNDYLIDASKESDRNGKYDLKTYSTENTWLTSKLQVLEVSPDTISFYLEKVVSAKLKIVPDLQIEFKPGYGLASEIVIMPESTIVSGSSHLIKNFQEVTTNLISLKDLSEKSEQVVELKNIPGLTYDVNSATVVLDVQRIIEHSFDDVSVKVVDTPKDRDVVLLPNKISVLLRGGINVLGKLDKEKIIAVVPYRDVVLDTIGLVKPNVNIPAFTELVSVKPERINYIIKKFKK